MLLLTCIGCGGDRDSQEVQLVHTERDKPKAFRLWDLPSTLIGIEEVVSRDKH